MNDRIKELIEQATIETVDLTWGKSYEFSKEKFAELLVRECIEVVDVGGEFVSRPKTVERLKEHFGVEE